MINTQYPERALTARVIGCVMEVHTVFGNGFQELIYQRALAIEMSQQGLQFTKEQERQLFYKGHEIGKRRVDFFVEGKVLVEIKAVIQLEDVRQAQAINYLEAYKMRVGLLLNFGSGSLQFRRVMNKRWEGG